MGYAWITAAVGVLAAILAVVLARRRERRMFKSISDMLEAAAGGDFTEDSFDETLLSAAESRMAAYLSASAASAKNIAAERDKIKTLIADISHQTKTPISNLLLYAQLLGEQELPESCRQLVDSIGAQAEKLDFLIRSLVKLSRLEAGIISVSPSVNSVSELMQEAQRQFVPKAEGKGLSFQVEDSDALACFDPKWTLEAVGNIVDNAVKYTPPGGRVTLRAVAYELFCCIEVTDTGIGIAEDEQSQVFGRFYRSGAVRDQAGVGIGLFLSREIIAAQGGYIRLRSVPGKGSTFSVFLPR